MERYAKAGGRTPATLKQLATLEEEAGQKVDMLLVVAAWEGGGWADGKLHR